MHRHFHAFARRARLLCVAIVGFAASLETRVARSDELVMGLELTWAQANDLCLEPGNAVSEPECLAALDSAIRDSAAASAHLDTWRGTCEATICGSRTSTVGPRRLVHAFAHDAVNSLYRCDTRVIRSSRQAPVERTLIRADGVSYIFGPNVGDRKHGFNELLIQYDPIDEGDVSGDFFPPKFYCPLTDPLPELLALYKQLAQSGDLLLDCRTEGDILEFRATFPSTDIITVIQCDRALGCLPRLVYVCAPDMKDLYLREYVKVGPAVVPLSALIVQQARAGVHASDANYYRVASFIFRNNVNGAIERSVFDFESVPLSDGARVVDRRNSQHYTFHDNRDVKAASAVDRHGSSPTSDVDRSVAIPSSGVSIAVPGLVAAIAVLCVLSSVVARRFAGQADRT